MLCLSATLFTYTLDGSQALDSFSLIQPLFAFGAEQAGEVSLDGLSLQSSV